MIISLIAAMSDNRVIGIRNQLPWHLPDDLKYFKALTQGKTVIMGRLTFESIGRALPKRRNVVLTTQNTFQNSSVDVFHSLDNALESCREESEVFIIGGASLYAASLELADQLYLTRVHTMLDGDAFFPEWNAKAWSLVESIPHSADESHAYAFTFEKYQRKL